MDDAKEMNAISNPLISVVTVNYNNGPELEETIKSIIHQTAQQVELIVIDGGSSDISIEVINLYRQKIAKFVSEKDDGIYDAMQKGVNLARGFYICFMNSGDRFYASTALAEMLPKLSESLPDIVYGGHEVRYSSGTKRIQWPKDPGNLWKGMICSHQSMLTSRRLLLKFGFDPLYRLNADYAFIYRAFRAGSSFTRVNTIVASVSAGGRSDVDRFTSITSRWKIIQADGFNVKSTCYYGWLLADSLIRKFLKQILPKTLVLKIIGAKRSHMLPLS